MSTPADSTAPEPSHSSAPSPASASGHAPAPSHPARPEGAESVSERVKRAYRRISAVDRAEVWISLRDEAEALAIAAGVEERLVQQGPSALPLAGLVIAVKDNIDVQGFPTTSALPSSSYEPGESAPAVARLEAAGAIVLGKTNLDQLATGLVGSRSPYGAVRAAFDPELVSGGSSSGSAVAVALELVDAALGTDTAGSGRVPAAFNRLIGIKPTLGLVPAQGVVPAAPSYDTVTVFAPTLERAGLIAGIMAGPAAADPTSRAWPSTAPLAPGPLLRIAVPRTENLTPLQESWRLAFDASVQRLRDQGAEILEVDISPLLQAARLLYGGALVAERSCAVGHLLNSEAVGVDPTVSSIIGSGASKQAVELVRDQQQLRGYKLLANELLADVDALLIPTAPGQPSLAEVAADPIVVNSWVGTYTNFVNLLDLAAIAVPGPDAADKPFGVTFVGPAFSDAALLQIAARFLDAPASAASIARHWAPASTLIAVFGAHMSGQPLNPQLTELGALLVGPVSTEPEYRMYALDTIPPKPGLVHDPATGASVSGELWAVPTGQLGRFLQQLARPMVVGKVRLADGTEQLGFLCEPGALSGAADITSRGSWTAHLLAQD